MKKTFLSLALAAILLLCTVLPVVAESATGTDTTAVTDNVINELSTDKVGSSQIKFKVDPTYTVTIPATLVLEKDNITGNYQKELTVEAQNIKLGYNYQIVVQFDDDLSAKSLQLLPIGTQYSIDYSVTIDGEAEGTNDFKSNSITFDTDDSIKLLVAANDPQYAGSYQGNLVFKISLTEKPTT